MAEKAGDVFVNVGARFNDLDRKFSQLTSRISSGFSKISSKIGNMFNGLGGTIAAAFSVRAIAEFTLEGVRLAGVMEGVEKAYRRMAEPELMNRLKEATRGTVSELELMQTVTKANALGLSLEPLPKLLEFARRRAKDTGMEVDYLVQSIVTGIGRKSPLILDNLGISATQLKEKLNGVTLESASIEDITRAVGEIAEDAYAGISEGATTGAEETAILNTKITELQTQLGEKLTPAVNNFKKAMIDALAGISVALDENVSTSNKLKMALALGTGGAIPNMQAYANAVSDAALEMAKAEQQTKNLQDDQMALDILYQKGIITQEQTIIKNNDISRSQAEVMVANYDLIMSEIAKQKAQEAAKKAADELAAKMLAIKEATAAYGKELKDNALPMMLAQYEVMKDLLGLDDLKVVDITPDINIDPQPVQDFRDEILAADEDFQNFLQNSVTNVAKMKEQAEMLQFAAMGISSAFQSLGNILIDSFGEAETAGGKFAQAMGRIVVNIISQALAASLAKSVQIATNTGAAAGPAGPVVFAATLGSMGAMVNAAFSSIPAFAKGGQSRGGMALVGERGPELVSLAKGAMVTPHHQMRGALNSRQMAMTVNVVGSLKGQDIYLSGSRGQTNLNR